MKDGISFEALLGIVIILKAMIQKQKLQNTRKCFQRIKIFTHQLKWIKLTNKRKWN